MTIAEATRTHTLAIAAVAAAIGTRLFPEQAQQDTPAPYIVSHVEIRPAEQTLDGSTILLEATLDLHSISPDYDQALQLAEALRQGLDNFIGVMGGPGGLEVGSTMFTETVPSAIQDTNLFACRSSFTLLYLP